MKFEVTRTSGGEESPCDEAFVDGKNEWNEDLYFVEFNTIEELVEFTNKYGKIILKDDWIEIYDDYRE